MAHPLAGTPLCRLDEITEGEGRGFVLGGGAERLEIFVVRAGDQVFGYVNACPHLGTPLNWGGFDGDGRFVSADSGNILCATHGAEFRVEDGYCLHGPCAGHRLLALQLDQGDDGLLRFVAVAPVCGG